jgi:phage terminase large subunit-like protein
MTYSAPPAGTETPTWLGEAADKEFGFVAREWAKASTVPGAWFDAELAERMVRLWPVWFRHTEGRWGNKPFNLAFWQACIVRLLFGWKMPDGTRLYRKLILWIGRKNGKSEFVASLAIAFWLVDEEFGGQGYCIAANESQARIVLGKMQTMVRLSPKLSKAATVSADALFCERLLARFEALTGKAAGKHGLSASVVSGDEIHEWSSSELYNTVHQSTSARDQPIELLCSTGGFKGRGYGWEVWQQCRAIEAGTRHAPDVLVAIFAADEADDWTKEETWRKACPNLGVSPTLRFLQDECAAAKDSPRLEADFRRYYLNQWVGVAKRWIPLDRWDAGAPDTTRWQRIAAEMAGRPCYGGLDLSSTEDLTALVWLFPPQEEGERWTILPRIWVPGDNIEKRVRTARVPYDRWAKPGVGHNGGPPLEPQLIKTEGNTVDYDAIREHVLADAGRYDVQMLAVDRLFQGQQVGVALAEAGLNVNFFGQGFLSMSPASKNFERLALSGQLDAGGHEVMRWGIENAAYKQDDAGNIKPSKAKAAEKIDMIVALIMAIGVAHMADDTVVIGSDALAVG